MEIAQAQAFSIDMEDPTSTYTLQGEKIKSVKLPTFLQNRLSKKEKPSLTKAQLEEKLSRAEALRLTKLDQKKLHAQHNSFKVSESYARQQEVLANADYYMRMCHDHKMAKGQVMHQVALQSKVTKAQKFGNERVEKAQYK